MRKLLALLGIVSFISSANIVAMAEKYEKLFPADKSKLARSLGSEQDFNAAAKKARLDVTWADYQASLAQKGAVTGEAVVTPPKPGPAPIKGVVITEAQIAALDKEATSLANLYFTLQSRTEALAMSTGTQEDAHAFMDAMKERHEEIFKKMDQSRKKPDFSSLPHKQKSPLTLQEKEAYKTKLQDKFNDLEALKETINLREFDQKWALGFINRELDDDYKEHDDAFFEEVIKSQGWRKNKIKEF